MEAKRREHVILFPFMAQGHIIPFLALALEIEKKKGYDITFVNTPLNIKKLRSSLPSSSSSIRFQEIPFDASKHGLPPYTENTDNLPYNLILHFLEVSASLKPVFRELVSNIVQKCKYDPSSDLSPPLCIIGDFFFGWTAEIAREFDIFHSILVANSAFGIAIYYSLWTNIPHWKVEGAQEYNIDDFPEGGKLHVTQLPGSMVAANGNDSWSIYLDKRLHEWQLSNAMIFNTVEEIDEVGLGYFKRKLGLPIYAMGPILLKKETNNNVSSSYDECLKWLDKKLPNSVLYICFGSQNTLTVSQMKELALALECSNRPFIWVVRPPLGFDFRSEFKAQEWLPKGFEQRVQENEMGYLIKNWAPQVEILSHGSIGGFISHCGWNSVLEAISHRVPILGWPMAAEQFFNAKYLVEEVGICVELGRGNGCKVEHEDIAKKIEMVMGDNNIDGEKIRKRALEVQKIVENAGKDDELGFKGSSVKAMDEFFTASILRRSEKISSVLEVK